MGYGSRLLAWADSGWAEGSGETHRGSLSREPGKDGWGLGPGGHAQWEHRIPGPSGCTEEVHGGQAPQEAGKAAGEAEGGCFLIHAVRSERLLDFQKSLGLGGRSQGDGEAHHGEEGPHRGGR